MNLFKKNIFWVINIILLSSIFRVFLLDLVEFKSDEAITVYQMIQFFDSPHLIERGLISGTGVYNFPLFSYLMIPLSLWSRDPMILSGVIAVINSLLIGAFFLFVRRYYNLMTAVFSSLLLAFSPWGVIFSRKIWAQDLIFLLFIPFLWLLHELILKKNSKVIFPLFILLALLIQLHGSGLFLFAVTIIIFLIMRIRTNPGRAICGFFVGLIPIVPYIVFQLGSIPSCPDCEAFMKYQQSIRSVDFNNLFRPFQIISGLGYHFVLGKNYSDFIAIYPVINQLKYIFTLGGLGILAGLFFVFFKKQKNIFLVIYFISIPLLYFITKTSAYMHYFVIILPISVLLFAIFVTETYSFVKKRFLKVLTIGIFLIFLGSNILFIYFFNSFLYNKKDIEGDYGPIYFLTRDRIEKGMKNDSILK
ncbi:MAG: hypothetical protein Q7R77_01615 [Candidatus Daviesbacteria bacterium]|nr:hypothetical protein [Candidatus Daviesbacteria bacterium]